MKDNALKLQRLLSEISYLYVMSRTDLDGRVKLGYSENPARRMLQIQSSIGYPVKLAHIEPVPAIFVRQYEKCLHKSLNYVRAKHGEWFEIPVQHAIGHVGFVIIDNEAKLLEELVLKIAYDLI